MTGLFLRDASSAAEGLSENKGIAYRVISDGMFNGELRIILIFTHF
jgi:hypothetical protein